MKNGVFCIARVGLAAHAWVLLKMGGYVRDR